MINKKQSLLVALTLSMVISASGMNVTYAASKKSKIENSVIERLSGGDTGNRYDTAVAISQKGWKNGSNTVILTSGRDFPDALSATPLAKKNEAPILLTETNNLPEVVKDEIKRLNPKKVIIVGGSGVVSESIADELSKFGRKVERIEGKDRYETAINVAKEIGVKNGVAVAYGYNYADALSISSIAASMGMPIILTATDNLPAEVSTFINENSIKKSYIVGGEGVVNNAVMSKFPNSERVSGIDRYETNVAVMKRFDTYIDYNKIYLSTGRNYPDALAGSSLAAINESPVILTESNYVPEVTYQYIVGKMSKEIYALGGQAIVGDNILDVLKVEMRYGEVYKVQDKSIEVKHKSEAKLPETVTAILADNSKKEIEVKWNESKLDTSEIGTKKYTGVAMGHDVTLTVKVIANIAKVDNINTVITKGDKFTFPTTVKATMTDGSVKDVAVKWNSTTIDTGKVGTYTYTGTLEGYGNKVTLTVAVKDPFRVIDIR